MDCVLYVNTCKLLEQLRAKRAVETPADPWNFRRDSHLEDELSIQGNWIPAIERPVSVFARQPDLCKYVTVIPGHSVNPDKHVIPRDRLKIYDMGHGLSSVYKPDGSYTASISTGRANLMAESYMPQAADDRALRERERECICIVHAMGFFPSMWGRRIKAQPFISA